MIKLLVVAASHERRARIVDALCELPGVEVCATASDAAAALGIIDRGAIDALVATSDLPGCSIVILIDGASRRGLTDVVVAMPERRPPPGSDDCWRDLGARHMVHTLPDLVARITDLGSERHHDNARRRAVAMQLELAAAAERPTTVRSYVTSPAATVVARGDHHLGAPQELSPGAVLHDALVRFGNVVPPEIQLHLEIGIDVPRVRCVSADIERIALLLVRGACESLPLGGNVWLFVEREGARHVRIEVLESSGRPHTPGVDDEAIRVIAKRHGGELRIVDLGGATSLQVILPASLQVQS
jgi:hypothetical protein